VPEVLEICPQDWDFGSTFDCASVFGGGWWHTACALFGPTVITGPTWFSRGDNSFHSMKKIRLMIKPQ